MQFLLSISLTYSGRQLLRIKINIIYGSSSQGSHYSHRFHHHHNTTSPYLRLEFCLSQSLTSAELKNRIQFSLISKIKRLKKKHDALNYSVLKVVRSYCASSVIVLSWENAHVLVVLRDTQFFSLTDC